MKKVAFANGNLQTYQGWDNVSTYCQAKGLGQQRTIHLPAGTL